MKQPIIKKLRARGWYLWLDTESTTYFIKRNWFCAVPYSETLQPVFGRMAKRVEVAA